MHHGIIRLQVHCVLKSGQQEKRRDPWLAEESCRLQVGQTTLDYKALLQGKETVGRKSPRSGPVMRMKGGARESRERTGLVCSFPWPAGGTQPWKSCGRYLIQLAWETTGFTKGLRKKVSSQWPLPSERDPVEWPVSHSPGLPSIPGPTLRSQGPITL